MEWTTQYVAGAFQVQQRSLENPNLPLNDPRVWDEVFGGYSGTEAGVAVNEDTALTYAPVWQAITMIASDVSCLPFNLYRRRPDISETAREKAGSDPRHYIVNIQPQEYMPAQQFWETFMTNVLLWNQSYAYIVWDNAGRLKELRHLLPDRTHAEVIDGRWMYITEYGEGRLKALFPWEVLHVRGLCPNGMDAPRFIKMARNSIALGLAQQNFASKFFKNGGRVGGVLELPASMPKPIAQGVEEGFRKTYEGGDSAFKTVILRDSAKFHAAQSSPQESQMTEAGESQVRMIARWFNLNPSKLGLSDSVSYNSKEEDQQGYLDSTLKRWLKKLAGECNIKLLSEDAQSQYFFEHDVSDLVRMNMEKRYAAYQIAIQNKIFNPNEVRAKENMLPYEGGDKYANPNNAETPTPEEKSPAPTRSYNWMERRVLLNMTATARHKSKKPAALLEWLDGEFKIQREEWRTLSGGASEPEFFVAFRTQLNDIVQTATPDLLASVVDNFAINFERTA